MARTRKSATTTSVNDIKELSEDQVNYLLEFARGLSGASYGGFPGVYNPLLTSEIMKSTTLSPIIATSDKIDEALNNPASNEQNLIGYSQDLELKDNIYKRLMLYLGNMLAFNLDWVCINAEPGDYTTPKYKKDYKILTDFIDKFNVKEEFPRVMRQLVRNEASFYQARFDNKDKYVLQEMPQSNCLITGRFPYGLTYDFNMSWFLRPGVSLDMYSDAFKRFYKIAFLDPNNGYNPAAQIDMRDGSWVYWVQTDPADGFFCWKLTSEIAARIPILAPMMPDIILKPVIRKLQTNIYAIAAAKILFGSVPYNKDVKGASVKDNFTISASQLGSFLSLLRSAISKEISVGAAPLENTSAIEFETPDRSIVEEYTKVTAGSSGINSRLIFSTDRMNIEETRNSISVDEYLMEMAYPSFENFINFNVNRLTKYFKFKFFLSGSNFDTSKRREFDNAMQLATTGFLLPGKVANSIGLNKLDLERMLAEAKAGKWDEKLIYLTSMFNTKGGTGAGGEGGRPQKKAGELGDAGAQTQEDGGNLAKGGSV